MAAAGRSLPFLSLGLMWTVARHPKGASMVRSCSRPVRMRYGEAVPGFRVDGVKFRTWTACWAASAQYDGGRLAHARSVRVRWLTVLMADSAVPFDSDESAGVGSWMISESSSNTEGRGKVAAAVGADKPDRVLGGLLALYLEETAEYVGAVREFGDEVNPSVS